MGVRGPYLNRLEKLTHNQEVVGSSPAGPTQLIVESNEYGSR